MNEFIVKGKKYDTSREYGNALFMSYLSEKGKQKIENEVYNFLNSKFGNEDKDYKSVLDCIYLTISSLENKLTHPDLAFIAKTLAGKTDLKLTILMSKDDLKSFEDMVNVDLVIGDFNKEGLDLISKNLRDGSKINPLKSQIGDYFGNLYTSKTISESIDD